MASTRDTGLPSTDEAAPSDFCLVSGAWLLSGCSHPVRQGAVLIQGKRISAAGSRVLLARAFPRAPEINFPGAAIVPGLVDCHSHLEIADILARVTPRNLFELMALVGEARRHASPIALEESRRKAATRSLREGVTCVVDWMSLSSRPAYCEPRPRIVRALEVICPDSDGVEMAEVRVEEAVLAHASTMQLGWDRLAFGPHSLYMTADGCWTRLVARARKLRAPITTHFAETPDERRWVVTGKGPLVEHCRRRSSIAQIPTGLAGPLDLLAGRGRLSCRPLLAHGVDIDDRELARLTTAGATLCLCPRSNQRLSGTLPRLDRLLAAGTRFVLGTDSVAGRQDLLAEARILLNHYPREAGVSRRVATRLLGAMTCETASALRWPGLGSILPRARADLAVFRVDAGRANNVALSLIQEGVPDAVFIGGRMIRARNGS